MTFKIIGLDESGKTGDEFLAFCQVEFDENDETKLFINNLMNIGDFFYSKEILNNTSSKKLVQLSQQLLSNGFIKAKFYKLTSRVQNLILKDIFKYQANHLFKIRSDLISLYKDLKSYLKSITDRLNLELDVFNNFENLYKTFRKLSHYDKYHRLPDYTMKSFSFLYILNSLCNEYDICEFLKDDHNNIKIQVDGGHLFTFWWYEFINNHDNKELLQNKIFINGIPNGDKHYLAMNIADLLSRAFNNNQNKFLEYEIADVKYRFKEIPISDDVFHNNIWRFLTKNVFKKRILFIGKSEFFNVIPYLLHRKNRKILYEPFKVIGKIQYFFKKHSRGYPIENIAIVGQDLNNEDNDNIKICDNHKIKIIHIKELKDNFEDFFTHLEDSSNDYGNRTKTQVKKILAEKKEKLKNIQEVNLL
ncbi:MAG: hypothetical protein ACFFG0_33700 [Candidatus Thorarchaeota archaeon]